MRCQKSCESLDKYYLMRLDIKSEYLFDSLSLHLPIYLWYVHISQFPNEQI